MSLFLDSQEMINLIVSNCTTTAEINIDLFELMNYSGLDYTIGQYNFTNSMIDKYSKYFHFQEPLDIKGRIFQNRKIMIYTKDINIDITMKNVLKKFQEIYKDSLFDQLYYQNARINVILSYQIPFKINFERLNDFLKVFKISEFRLDKNKMIRRNNYIYYFISSRAKYSISIFKSGKIQARAVGNRTIVENLYYFCINFYQDLIKNKSVIIYN